MAKTVSEKILSTASGDDAFAGDFVEAEVDWAMVHEGLGMGVADAYEEIRPDQPPVILDKIVSVLDHWAPPPNENAAKIHEEVRSFVKKYGVKHWYDIKGGICHQVLLEHHARPGEIVVGTDSHTTTVGSLGAFGTGLGNTDMAAVFARGRTWFKVPPTVRWDLTGELGPWVYGKDVILRVMEEMTADGATYKAVEYRGEGIHAMSMDSRATLANMTVDMGGKAGLVEVDDRTMAYLESRGRGAKEVVHPDDDAEYEQRFELDVSDLEPLVAEPPSPDTGRPVGDLAGTPVTQCFVGSCTNARKEDLLAVERILQGRTVHEDVRLIVVPSSVELWKWASKEGIWDVVMEAGGTVGNSTCGPCIAASLGVLGPSDVCLSSANRNYQGRMGSKEAEIYLANPAVVTASAVTGEITDPRELMADDGAGDAGPGTSGSVRRQEVLA